MKPLNIIIAGIGGQGIFTGAEIFHTLFHQAGLPSIGSMFKGGAQRLGAVHAQLRIFTEPTADFSMYSCEIPCGELDLLIGLEPSEALRYQKFFKQETTLVVNSHKEPFFLERSLNLKCFDPVTILNKLPNKIILQNFTKEAQEIFNSTKMINYLAALRAIRTGILPLQEKALHEAFQRRFKFSLERSETILDMP